MPAIGTVHLGSVPRVVLAVEGYTPDLKTAYGEGVSVLEARIDLFGRTDPASVLDELRRLRGTGLPVLATFRPKSEGGAWTGGDEERKRCLLGALESADAVDIELSASGVHGSVIEAYKRAGKTVIVSHHDLAQSPELPVLERLFRDAKGLGADIVKLACLARCEADVTRLLAFVERHKAEGVVGISMGPAGGVSRVAAPLFGSLLCYTSRTLNYGQLPLGALVGILKALYPAFDEDLEKRRHPPETRVP